MADSRAQREAVVRAMLEKKQAAALSSAVPTAPSVSSAAEGLFGMDPMIERLNLLPRWSREEGLVAPQVVYQAARALVSPGVAAQGGRVSEEDAVNFGGMVGSGGIAASAAMPAAMPAKGPGRTLGMFAGPKAKTANLAALEKAKALLASGVDDASVWNETGWWVNTPDGIPRTELPDGIESFRAAYPDSTVVFNKDTGVNNYNSTRKAVDYDDVNLPHETQHAVQDMEGMDGGSGNYTYHDVTPEQIKAVKADSAAPDVLEKMEENHSLWGIANLSERDWADLAAARLYMRKGGEAEARAVNARKAFSDQMKKSTPPWESYDVPIDRLIIKK